MQIKLTAPTTERNSCPLEENEFTEFTITDNALSIDSLDGAGTVLYQTEISIEDAVKLAKLILTLNN